MADLHFNSKDNVSCDQLANLSQLAGEIAEGGRRRYEQVRGIFGLLGDKWSILILLVLSTGRLRHATLKRTLNALAGGDRISQRILTLKLRIFERWSLVDRRVSDDTPANVDYSLTPTGKELAERVRTLIGWIECSLN